MATYRFSMNDFPNASTTATRSSPPATPVAIPATVTTSSGFSRSTNPTITITTPTSTNQCMAGGVGGEARGLGGAAFKVPLRLTVATIYASVTFPHVQPDPGDER